MKKGGAKINKVKLVYLSEANRGVIATEDIMEGDILLYIPYHMVKTFGVTVTDQRPKQMNLRLINKWG